MDKWITISFFIDNTIKEGNPAIIKITRDFYIIDNLKANMLIGMDILYLEKAVIDLLVRKILFSSCEHIVVLVEYTPYNNIQVRRIVHADNI